MNNPFLREFTANIPALVFVKDAEGRYTHVNSRFELFFGLSRESVIGKTDKEIFPAAQAASFMANDREVFTSGKSVEFEERAQYVDGIHVSIVSKFPLRDSEGKITGLCGIATDITERKRIEERLLATTEDFAEAQRIAHFGTWESDYTHAGEGEESTVRWSDEMYRIAGLDPKGPPITRSKFYEMVHPDDREEVMRATEIAKREGCHYSIIHRLIRPNGEVRVLHETAHVHFDPESGGLARLFGTAHDITEQHEAEHRFRQVTENIQEVFWLTSAENGQVLYVSPSYEAVWGRPCEELYRSPQSWLEAMDPRDRPSVLASMKDLAEGTYHTEYRIHRPDGSERWIADRARPIRDGEGRVSRYAGVAQDITERKRVELELARSNRSLHMLTACHESLIRASDELALIHEICDLLVQMGGYRMAWVGYNDRDNPQVIRPMAWAGTERDQICRLCPLGENAAGFEEGRIAAHLKCQENGGRISVNGEAGTVCLPLENASGPLGRLTVHTKDAEQVSAAELKLLRDLAEDLAFGITGLRSRIERQHVQDVVLKVAQSVSTAAGAEFLQTLTRNMVEAVGAAGGAIGRVNPEDRDKVDTLTFHLRGQDLENVRYSVKGTPCEDVVAGNLCVYEQGIQQLFPEDTMLADLGLHAYAGIPLHTRSGEVHGLMAVFFDAPLRDVELVKSTLRILAARAGSEIERKEADARIREQASLLDKARDAIIVRDLEYRVVYWNKSAERLYGWKAAEVVGKPVNQLLYRDAVAFRLADEKVLSTGEWQGELDQVDHQGRPLVIEGRWTLVHDDKGDPKGVLAINTDITERKKLEAQFLRAQRMESIGTLAGGIAHDLNNVLAPILMSIQLLRQQEPESSRDLLELIETSAQRGSDLVRQVLSFARGVDGLRVPFAPSRVVNDIEKIIRDTFPKNIQAQIHMASNLWPIEGDPTQLHQVLMNLCVNARDAMATGGTLTIAFENVHLDSVQSYFPPEAKPGPHVRITVSDTGSGMPREILDKIFEPFFTTKEIGRGTGLGLSTTLAIVKSHGGFIHVDSTLGKGSHFHAYFPTVPARAAARNAGFSESSALPAGCGELLMIVDDESSVRELAKRILERNGYRVVLAAHGAEAMAIYQQQGQEIALVLTDMAMPIMDGPATIRALRQMNPAARIIGSSGLSTSSAVEKAIGEKLDDFIQKPYTASEMLKAIRAVLNA